MVLSTFSIFKERELVVCSKKPKLELSWQLVDLLLTFFFHFCVPHRKKEFLHNKFRNNIYRFTFFSLALQLLLRLAHIFIQLVDGSALPASALMPAETGNIVPVIPAQTPFTGPGNGAITLRRVLLIAESKAVVLATCTLDWNLHRTTLLAIALRVALEIAFMAAHKLL